MPLFFPLLLDAGSWFPTHESQNDSWMGHPQFVAGTDDQIAAIPATKICRRETEHSTQESGPVYFTSTTDAF
jgi:hypothetical protein